MRLQRSATQRAGTMSDSEDDIYAGDERRRTPDAGGVGEKGAASARSRRRRTSGGAAPRYNEQSSSDEAAEAEGSEESEDAEEASEASVSEASEKSEDSEESEASEVDIAAAKVPSPRKRKPQSNRKAAPKQIKREETTSEASEDEVVVANTSSPRKRKPQYTRKAAPKQIKQEAMTSEASESEDEVVVVDKVASPRKRQPQSSRKTVPQQIKQEARTAKAATDEDDDAEEAATSGVGDKASNAAVTSSATTRPNNEGIDVVIPHALLNKHQGPGKNECTMLVQVEATDETSHHLDFHGQSGAIGRFEADDEGGEMRCLLRAFSWLHLLRILLTNTRACSHSRSQRVPVPGHDTTGTHRHGACTDARRPAESGGVSASSGTVAPCVGLPLHLAPSHTDIPSSASRTSSSPSTPAPRRTSWPSWTRW